MEEQKSNEQNAFNPFASVETPSNSYGGQTHGSSVWDAPASASLNEASPKQAPLPGGQAQFPRFGNAKLDPSKIDAGAADIRKRMEDAKSNGWGAQLMSFAGTHKSRIAILLAVGAVVVAGSYASRFNGPSEEAGASTAALSQQTEEDSQDAGVFDIKLDNQGTVILESAGNDSGLLAQGGDGSGITKTAESGEGITHLARRALADYLQGTGKNLSAEQKIYAEDYVKDLTGDEWLDIGQKLSFSQELLQDAVQAAEGLQDWQIENLKQYTASVSLL